MALFVLGVILSVALGLLLAPYLFTVIAVMLGFLIIFGGFGLLLLWLDMQDDDPPE